MYLSKGSIKKSTLRPFRLKFKMAVIKGFVCREYSNIKRETSQSDNIF